MKSVMNSRRAGAVSPMLVVLILFLGAVGTFGTLWWTGNVDVPGLDHLRDGETATGGNHEGQIAVPIAAREIPAYSKVRRDDFWLPETQEFASVWLDEDVVGKWTPRCDVIVHGSLAEYQQALGAEVGRSVGCATMKVDGGRIVSRRIDIRVDADAWEIDALPHELTHVVLADHFNGRRLPPWADEGIGVLSESARKQKIRADAFKESASRGYVYRPHDLLSLRHFPAAGYREAFYAQSAALVRELVERKSHRALIECVEQTLDDGETAALANVYNIRSANSLDEITKVDAVRLSLSHALVTTAEQPLIAAAGD